MEKNEIRIGNIVYDSLNHSYDIVIGINNNDTVDFPFELNNDICFVDGIKINSDIIKKLEFTQDNPTAEHYVKTYNDPLDKNYIKMTMFFANNKWTLCIIFGEDSSIVLKDIKYVHQIQNAFFMVTGEELDINNFLI
jgi:hypothetical protein